MGLRMTGTIDLPPHTKPGGFDHAAIHTRTDRLYVAHTANDAVDVVDCARGAYTHSIGGLTGVAGVLVSEARGLVFTSNRGEDTVGIVRLGAGETMVKVPVGVRPNGLAFDPERGVLIAANVGDPAVPDSFTLSVVDVDAQSVRGVVPVPGRTRWAVYDPRSAWFFVNTADPACTIVVRADDATQIARSYKVPAMGPHGLDVDSGTGRLFCACDEGQLVTLEAATGRVLTMVPLSGAPDVIFFNPSRARLYVAVGDPGVIDVIETASMTRIETVATERGAHTLAIDLGRNTVYAFLPQSHRAAVFADE